MVAEIHPVRIRDSVSAEDRRSARIAVARETARQDAVLVDRFKTGDDLAFEEIITRYRQKLASFALGVLHNYADAEEIAQDTLIRAHRNLPLFRGDCKLATWLYAIALNLARNRYWYHFRRRRQETQSLDCPISDDSPATFSELAASDAPSPVEEAATREFSAAVHSCIERMAPLHRDILERRVLQNSSYDEIAVALHINVGTVKSRIARARERLRALLAIQCPEFASDVAFAASATPESGIGPGRSPPTVLA